MRHGGDFLLKSNENLNANLKNKHKKRAIQRKRFREKWMERV